jgi:4-hydroxy 2-oxovalerate aldolase
MGTYIPDFALNKTLELKEINFTKIKEESHTSIALQLSLELGCEKIYLTGYDGYQGDQIAQKDQELFIQNSQLFEDFSKKAEIISITPTLHTNIESSSVYQFIK